MRRAYVDAGWGQVHYRESGMGPTLACLHATAYSGRSLSPLMPFLASRRVVALDTPGYGGSDGPPAPTGALLATEIAAYPREWWAHAALFDYDVAARLPLVRCPVLVINPVTPLAEFSRAATAVIPGAIIREMPEVPPAPFDTAAAAVADAIEVFLR